MKFKLIIVLLYLTLHPVSVMAQYCEWLKTVEKTTGEDIYADDGGNVVMIGRITANTTLSGVSLYANNFENSYLAKYDSSGLFQWVIQTTLNSTGGTNSCTFSKIDGDASCNYYIVGQAYGSINFGNGVILSATNSQSHRFVLKVNAAGLPQWVRGIASTSTAGQLGVAVDNQREVCLSLSFSGTLSMGGTTTTYTSTGNSSDLLAIKYDTSGALVWAKQYGGSGSQTTFRTIGVDVDRNIYLKLYNVDTWTFGHIQIVDTGLLLLKLNQNGDPINAKSIPTGNMGGGYLGTFPDGRFIIVGHFNATIEFSSTLHLVHSSAAPTSSYVAFFDSSLKCKWAIQTQGVNNGYLSFISNPVMRENGIYLGGGARTDDVYFGATRIKVYGPTRHTAVMTKLDTLGNILWCFFTGCSNCGSDAYGATVDRNGDSYFCGNWADTIEVFNRQAVTSGSGFNSFGAKISDYAISRGNVNSGPYCAGDSIKIPYTKNGEYYSGNEFIAQLSDSAGNFDSGFRELGRIQSTGDGEITGTLPLFNVATGARYRIRVISTNPIVQSYYLKDTLRLLIFSKDTANAGEDFPICEGQHARLYTSGGSKWQWTPSRDFLDPADSAKAAGFIAPDTSTEYRIIISDSSGCGLTDTDYVFIQVRPPLEVQVPAVVKFCVLRNARVEARGTGGDSSSYHFKWWWDGDANKTILSDSGILSISPFSTRRYWVKLTDSCSSLSDSALVTVSPESGVSLTEIPDTTLCYGQSINIALSSLACDSSAIVYYWNNGLGTGLSKTLSPLQSTDYQVVARDTVDGRTDTVNFRVNVLLALDVSLGNDTLLCKGQDLTIYPGIVGGNSAYRYRWMMDTGSGYQYLDTIASVSFKADKAISYRLHVTDQCSAPSDSDEIHISVRDELHIDITEDTLVCQGENILLWSQSTGGNDSNHLIYWYDEQSTVIDTGKTLPLKLNSAKGFRAVLMDNCTIDPDTAFVFVDVRDGLSISAISGITLCHGAEYLVDPDLSGGLVSSYKTFLKKEGEGLSEITTPHSLMPDSSVLYTLVLKDGCSEDSAFISFQIDVSDPLEAAIEVTDSVCAGAPLNLKARLKGGLPASYDIDWFRNDTLLNMNTTGWYDFPQSTTKYVLVVGDGCSDKSYDSVQVLVLHKPQADFLVSDTLGCSPLSITLSDNSLYHDSTRNVWKVAGPFYESENAEITLEKPGTYDISLTVYNELNCMDEQTQQKRVLVYPKPVALFDVYPSARQTDEVLLLIRKGTGANAYYWDIGDGNFIHTTRDTLSYTYKDSGFYSITHIAVNKEGCSDTAIYGMQVYLSPFCAIPNAFSVNGDRLNETFFPDCSGISGYTMTIFNRWGQIMLECDNCAWDGSFEGVPVPGGVYHYRIDYITHMGERVFAVGAVSVLR